MNPFIHRRMHMKIHPLLNPIAAVALAASAALALGGCASSSGIASSAQLIQPASIGLDANAPSATAVSDWWSNFGDAHVNELITRALSANPSQIGRAHTPDTP